MEKRHREATASAEHRANASVSIKAQLLAKHYPTEKPLRGKERTFTHTDSPGIVEEGKPATFDVGGFWDHIVWQFADDSAPRSGPTLNKDSMQLVRDKCAWIPKELQDRAARAEHWSSNCKAQLIARHYPTKKPHQGEKRTFTPADSPGILEEGKSITFGVSSFWDRIVWQFAGEDKPPGAAGGLTEDSIQLIRDKCVASKGAREAGIHDFGDEER